MIKNVLVVDSDQVMLQTLTGILKSQGGFLTILSVNNTKQAIALLQKKTIDIVITAIRLPKMDGFRLVAKLTKEYPSIKVIIITNDAHPLLRASIKRFPAASHLDQSYDISMLTKRVFTELQIDYGGGIRGINLSSFLQMMELESCTCALRVTSKNFLGFLWLKNGELIAAKSQTAEGKEAALDILVWSNVFIDIDYTPCEVEQQITTPLIRLIFESSQYNDERLSSNKNKRAHKRYDLLIALEFSVENITRQCLLRDISLQGAYIETDQELVLGQTIILVLTSPLLKSSCSIEAEVVRKDSRGAGFLFKITSSEQQEMIKLMINSSIKSFDQDEQADLSPA